MTTLDTRPPPDSSDTDTAAAEHAARRRERVGFALALGAAVLFSLKGIVIKLALARGADVETLMLWRMSLSLPVYLVIGAFAFRRRGCETPGFSPRTLAAAAGLGVLSYYVCTWLDFTGLRFITAQFERMLLFTYPILTALLSRVLLGERFTRRHAAALGLSYAGVVAVFGAEAKTLGPNAGWGALLVFAAALLFAFYVIAARPVIHRLGAQRFTCVAMAAATAAIVTHQLVRLGFTDVPGAGANWFTPVAIGAGAFLALVCTVVPSFMLSEAIARIGPNRTSAAGNAGPVVTTGLAVWVLHEPFGVVRAAGLVLILVGVGLVGRGTNRDKKNRD